MLLYDKEDIKNAIDYVQSTIKNCEKIQPKFKEGSSQSSLLRNRIKALMISKALLCGEEEMVFSDTELKQALPPITSIISKCRKAQEKYEVGTKQYQRFQSMIDPMLISKAYLEEALNKE